ncbi:syntaxin-5 [Drosophila mauritiana]|uniref:Syntaxin-5 n=1 Tax=Drosophila mauritiana TaxID=7226 RepID=A0A6P8KVZ5_DROMA|nr:syntaxin-5 [Drosophila mauritiana]XP_033173303.1 syntaxin-5 [Drosophila mauritiana]
MQTRRRVHQTDQQDYSSSSTYTIQEDQQGGAGAGSVGTGTAGGSVGLLAQSLVPPPTGHEATIHIGDNHQLGDSISTPDYSDDKYGKAARQWNLRAFSGHALRTLSAAAAVVTGNQPGNNNDSQSNYSYPASIPTSSQFYQSKEEPQEPEPEPEIFVMAARDRTGEFANAIRSLQARNITRAVNIRDPRKAKQVQSYSEFMMVARFIGKNIASTYAKLEKLTMLAKKKSLFDDRPQEIQELTYIIKGDLNALNQQIARLQDISKDQRRHTNGKHLVSHSSNMVLALQSKLASMSTDFKQILEVRTENLKQQKTRRDQFSQGPGPLAAHTVSPSTAKQGSLLLSEENQAVSIDMGSSDTTPLLSTQTQMAIYDDSDNYVQQRAETMQNIESTIVELGGIFQQLAHMVKEQEEIVERIDTNVADAELNIEAAHGEILKYFQSVSKNRWLMIKIFGVLIFFFLFFVVFMS